MRANDKTDQSAVKKSAAEFAAKPSAKPTDKAAEKTVELAATPELAAAQWSKLYRENAAFRAEFDKDPRQAISRRVGVDIPAEIKVVVHRKQAGEIHITVPDNVDDDEFHMSNEALREVHGGTVTLWLPAMGSGPASAVQFPSWAAGPIRELIHGRRNTDIHLGGLGIFGLFP